VTLTLTLVVVALVSAVATGYAYFRSSAVKVWEQNSEAYRARVELLEKQNRELESKLRWMEQRIHELEARPDWTQVVAVVGVTERNIIAAIKEMRAEITTERTRVHLKEGEKNGA